MALEGTTSCASHALHGPNGLTRQLSHGPTRSYHPAITPVVVCPGRSQVIAFPPEDLMPQDGPAHQDGAQMAGNRGIRPQANARAPPPVTFLGAARYSQQPCGAWALAQGGNCILGCQPAAPPQLYERGAFWHATDGMAAWQRRHWHGRCPAVTR